MSRTYYVIELTARWLAVLVLGLAVLLVLAFALGYGAAWSVLAGHAPSPAAAPGVATPTPTVTAVFVVPTAPPTASTTAAAPPAATATAIPATATPAATATRRPPTATPRPPATPTPTPQVVDAGLWVQVLATGRPESVTEARTRLERLGFPPDHQQVAEAEVAGGNVLYKVRVGPFPDRESAERVVRRMQADGFPDAWVVTP